MRTYKLVVLECDTPVPVVLEKQGTYGQIFERFARRGLEAYKQDGGKEEIDLQISASHMVDLGELPDPKEVDCLMLTGSKHNAFGDDEWIVRLVDYVREVYKTTQIPLVGICFGHQIIARALGAEVKRNAGVWEVSVDQFTLSPKGKELFGRDELFLHQMHQDIVSTLPEGAVNLGSSPKCEIQGMYIPRRVISVQAHPEFSQAIMEGVLNVRRGKVLNEELFTSGMARAEKPHDGLLVSKTIWRFLFGEL